MNIQPRFLPWWKSNCSDYKALLLDIDGTLIKAGHPLPGATAALAWLRRHHFPFCLLTNDGDRSPREKQEILSRAGLEVRPEEIVSCGMALNSFAHDPASTERVFFVVGQLGHPSYADTAGLATTRDPEQIDCCTGIIIGEGVYDWRRKLNAAVNALLRDPDKMLIVPNPDSYWPDGLNGEIGIGAGGKARFLISILAEAGVTVRPVYLGKPYPAIFKLALEILQARFNLANLPAEQVLMIGDSLKSDIAGANRTGLNSALVLTGITDREQAAVAGAEEIPKLVFESM